MFLFKHGIDMRFSQKKVSRTIYHSIWTLSQ